MIQRIPLPDLYSTLKGTNKKRFVWTYIQLHFPDHAPLKDQPYLFTDNIVLLQRKELQEQAE